MKTVLAGGETVVDAGRHKARPAIEARYTTTLARLTDIGLPHPFVMAGLVPAISIRRARLCH